MMEGSTARYSFSLWILYGIFCFEHSIIANKFIISVETSNTVQIEDWIFFIAKIEYKTSSILFQAHWATFLSKCQDYINSEIEQRDFHIKKSKQWRESVILEYDFAIFLIKVTLCTV